jgi:soluble P-type ATPase
MITVSIPDFGQLELAHLVLDYNGTLAVDGKLLPGVRKKLTALSSLLTIHIVTGDTFGLAASQLKGLPCQLFILSKTRQLAAKLGYIRKLGVTSCVCIGNGRNDAAMLKTSALGIIVLQTEGAAGQTLQAADVVCTHILDAFDLLDHPKRLIATLRA